MQLQQGYETGDGTEQALPVGVHSQLSDLAKRIAASVAQADKMLDRASGPKPKDSGPINKEAHEPSTREWATLCHKAMAQLENRLADLQQVIS